MNDRLPACTWAALSLGFAMSWASLAGAHEGHEGPAPLPSPRTSPTVTTVVAGSAASDSIDESAAPSAEEGEEAPPIEIPPADEMPNPLSPFPWKSIFTEHLHNKIIHFPFAFGMAGALLLLTGRRWPAHEPAARVLLVGAALAAIGAFFTGRMQQEAFEDGALEPVLKIHRLLGLSTAVFLWLGVILTSRAGARRYWPVYAVFLVALITATATFGGLLSHGQF